MATNLTGCATNGAVIVEPRGVMEELATQAAAARESTSPGGSTVTPAERDAMEAHARARMTAIYSSFAEHLDARSPLSGALKVCRDGVRVGVSAQALATTAKGMVDLALHPPATQRTPQSSPPRPQQPLAPAGTVYDI